MDLKELIERGESFYNKVQQYDFGEYIIGEEYVQWISEVAIYMEDKTLPDVLRKKLDNAIENAVGNGKEYLETILGILKAVDRNIKK